MNIGILGAGGRMGRMLVAEVTNTEGAALAGGTEVPGNPMIGMDTGALAGVGDNNITITDDAAALFRLSDVVIDFTLPAATIGNATLARETGTALVIGTTGLSDEQQAAIETAATKTAVVQAPNFSMGVNLLFALTQRVAAILDEDFDIEILEMHHRHKVDAPSGTALGLGQAAAAGRAINLAEKSQRVRDGHTGPRDTGSIGFATLRGGDVVGEHTVMFAGPSERVELTHKAASREIFARGAVRAALWTAGKPPGLYSMLDVLGLSPTTAQR
ncbi:MAG: 4-hydroxy-tetrahydrodipicolinate reductase [Magnetospiraceae bacterium]